jgi:hypothetical protein
VHIVTDSDRFPRFYHQKWMKKDGTPVANYPLYKKIMELLKGVNVSFYVDFNLSSSIFRPLSRICHQSLTPKSSRHCCWLKMDLLIRLNPNNRSVVPRINLMQISV